MKTKERRAIDRIKGFCDLLEDDYNKTLQAPVSEISESWAKCTKSVVKCIREILKETGAK